MEIKEKIEVALDKIRPALQGDGGNVKLIKVDDDNKVFVKLTGACNGCPFATMTLKYSIEKKLKEEVPEVSAVEAVN